jgi:hypothetical protein
MTAFPSDDMAIRNAFRPFGGDGVISSSFRTIASPSNDIDSRSEGGDLTGVVFTSFTNWSRFFSPRISSVDRFRFGACNKDSSWLFCSLMLCPESSP